MGAKTIKVKFVDFWPDFDVQQFIFYQLLQKKYDVIIDETPDILFYSNNGSNHTKYTCTKVFYTGENIRPDFLDCDFSFSYDFPTNEKNYRFPLFVLYDDINKLVDKKIDLQETLKSKTKFCCFVVSNPCCKIRNDFYLDFSEHKHIDSGGTLYNNIGGEILSKRDFIRDYKFVIAFENCKQPGYTTEKIFEPLLEDCVPIYWGNPLIQKDFNPKRFINCHDFPSFEEVMKHILAVDDDDEKYLQYLKEPAFNNNLVDPNLKEENVLIRLSEIIYAHEHRSIFKVFIQKLRPIYSRIKVLYNKIANKL